MKKINLKHFCLKVSKTVLFLCIFSLSASLFAKEPLIEAENEINWISRTFQSKLYYYTDSSDFVMPSGKKSASNSIKTKMPQLIQPSLLALYADSSKYLSDSVVDNALSLDQVTDFIMNGKKTTDVFSQDTKTLNTSNTLKVDELGKILVRHNTAYPPAEPIDVVPSRKFTGIVIDARGEFPVHGEYVSSNVNAAFFPQIWDDQMDLIYERNMVSPDLIKDTGLVVYDFSDDMSRYESRIGADPLYIKATQVYGRNRTDPIIKHSDALKILTIEENRNLIRDGKVVILLNKENLIYKIATPIKDDSYYVKYGIVKQYFFENKIQDIQVTDSLNGILFSVDLKFYPDSDQLLPTEQRRIDAIAESLSMILSDNSYTILIEGHTADVGKPIGQLNLSIDRTRTIMKALIDKGIDEELFTYKGYGGTMPVAPNDTEEGRAQNRRVDITARPRATYIQRDW